MPGRSLYGSSPASWSPSTPTPPASKPTTEQRLSDLEKRVTKLEQEA